MAPKVRDVHSQEQAEPSQKAQATSQHRGLSGPEAAVIIVLVVTSAVLGALGMELIAILQLLLGAGAIAATTIALLHIRSSSRRRLHKVLRALLGPTT